MGATDGWNRSITVSGDGGIVARSTGSGATWAIALNGVSVENLRDVLFLTSGIVLAVGANETIGSTNATWTLQNSAGGHLEKLAYDRRECHRSVPPSSSFQQRSPIPFQSKWLLCSSS